MGSFRWWETASAEAGVRRAVVIWLRELGRVVWWIADGDATLGLGYVETVEPPGDGALDEAKRAAERRWRELGW